MCADKLGPVARGLVVDGVGSRVLVGSSCHLHRQHVDLYSPRRTPPSSVQLLLLLFVCLVRIETSHKRTGAGQPTCGFFEFHYSGPNVETSLLNDKEILRRMAVVWRITFLSRWKGAETEVTVTPLGSNVYFPCKSRHRPSCVVVAQMKGICTAKLHKAAQPPSAADTQPG